MARFLEIAELLQQNFRSGEYPEGKYPSLRKIAAESMYQAIVNGVPPRCTAIPFTLIERESVRPPPHGLYFPFFPNKFRHPFEHRHI